MGIAVIKLDEADAMDTKYCAWNTNKLDAETSAVIWHVFGNEKSTQLQQPSKL